MARGAAPGWLSALAGGMQGLLEGIKYNEQLAMQQRQSDLQYLMWWAQNGDEETQRIALEGLTDLHAKSGGWKSAFKGPQAHPSVQQLKDLLVAREPAAPPPGPPGVTAPEAGSGAPTASPIFAGEGQGEGQGEPGPTGPIPPKAPPLAVPQPQGQAQGQGQEQGQGQGQPPQPPQVQPQSQPQPQAQAAALPSTSPIAATGSSAGISDLAGQVAAAKQAYTQAGMAPQPREDPQALRTRVAKEFGYTPQDLESPDFAVKNHLRDPRREQLQREYRTRVTQAEQQAGVEQRAEESDFRRGVFEYVRAMRQEASAATREKERDVDYERRQKDAEKREDVRWSRRQGETEHREQARMKERALFDYKRELAAAESGLPKDPLQRKMMLKQDPGYVERKRQEAAERYRMVTGEEPPTSSASSIRGSTGSAVSAVGKRPPSAPSTSSPPPSAAPMPLAVSHGPRGLEAAASQTSRTSSQTGGPPAAPITAEEERRASLLLAQLKRQGVDSFDVLPPEDQRFLRDYMARRRGQRG